MMASAQMAEVEADDAAGSVTERNPIIVARRRLEYVRERLKELRDERARLMEEKDRLVAELTAAR